MTDKDIEWLGSSLDDIRDFPFEARSETGHQLRKVQRNQLPTDYTALPEVGPGAIEIRVRKNDSWFRTIYVAKWTDTVYVLHTIQKKSNRMSKTDKDTAKQRYRQAKESAAAQNKKEKKR